MKHRIFYALIPVPLVLLCTSCGTSLYTPQTQNVPLHTEAKSLQIKGGLGSGFSTNRIADFQASYAATSNLATMANFGLVRTFDEKYPTKGVLWELGMGYYRASKSSDWVFEVYGGYGHYSAHHETWFGSNDFKAHRVFVQPNIGVSSDYFDLALSLRSVYVNYYHENQFIRSRENYGKTYLLSENQHHLMLEPALTFRTGYKYVQFQVQYGFSENVFNNEFSQDPLMGSAMLVFKF